jgi:hypothetical protein
MWIFLFFLLFQSNAAPCPSTASSPTGTPSLVVQAVDPEYLPIIGAHVTIKALNGNTEAISVSTDGDGYAKIFASEDSEEYSVEISRVGFKNLRAKSVHIGARGHTPHTAYVQFVMKLSGPKVAVY